MIQLRAAAADDADLLSELAYRSELYWGNDETYMDNFRRHYKITEGFIQRNPVFVFEEERKPVGFWGLTQPEDDWGMTEPEDWELEFFYIAAPYIGKGYGRLLWYSMIEECRKMQLKSIEFVTSPEAKEFYEKMGAKTICTVESLVKNGRMVPKLKYYI